MRYRGTVIRSTNTDSKNYMVPHRPFIESSDNKTQCFCNMQQKEVCSCIFRSSKIRQRRIWSTGSLSTNTDSFILIQCSKVLINYYIKNQAALDFSQSNFSQKTPQPKKRSKNSFKSLL